MVTGAANGIGRAIALRLRDDGFAVAAADIEPVEPADGVLPCTARRRRHRRSTTAARPDRAELGPLAALVNVAGIFVAENIEELTLAA